MPPAGRHVGVGKAGIATGLQGAGFRFDLGGADCLPGRRQVGVLPTCGLVPGAYFRHACRQPSRPRCGSDLGQLAALDDDQIAARTGIAPRQVMNQICRAVERAGMVRRRAGPDGKIVNEWVGDQDREPGSTPGPASTPVPAMAAPADPVVTANRAVPAGDSAEQRGAERMMLDLLGAQLGRELNPATSSSRPGSASKLTAPTRAGNSWPSAGHTKGRRRARKSTRS